MTAKALSRPHRRLGVLVSWTVAGVFCACFASAQVEDQLEYNFLGAGARANGMGDAFIAVADDATAIFWNPAGLFLLDQPEASFGFQFVSTTFEQERRQQMLLFSSNDPGESFGLNFASFVYPKRFGEKKFVFAFAIQRAFDFKAESLEIGDGSPGILDQVKSSGGPFNYSGGAAFSPFQGLMLGLSVNLYRGAADITENEIEAFEDGLTGTLSAFSRLPVEGTSVGVGALYDFRSRGGPPVSLGVKFVPRFDFTGKIESDLGIRIRGPEGVVVDGTLQGGSDYVLQFPLDVGIGVAWTPHRNLLVAADFEHRRFRNATLSVFGTPNVSIGENGELIVSPSDEVNQLSDSGSDLNQVRAGLEWSWVRGLNVIPIRFGIKNLPQVSAHQRRFVSPNDGALTTVFDDQVIGTALTSGIGVVTDTFVLDLSLEYGGWTQKITQFDTGGSHLQTLETRRFSLKTSVVIYF